MSQQSGFHQVEMGSERSFGLIFAAIFALVGALPLLTGSGGARLWALAVAVTFALVALFVPHWLAPLNRLWFRFGLLLGKVVAPLVMGLVFFVAVTPLAALARLVGKDFLATGGDAKRRGSHWVKRVHDGEHPSSMNNQF